MEQYSVKLQLQCSFWAFIKTLLQLQMCFSIFPKWEKRVHSGWLRLELKRLKHPDITSIHSVFTCIFKLRYICVIDLNSFVYSGALLRNTSYMCTGSENISLRECDGFASRSKKRYSVDFRLAISNPDEAIQACALQSNDVQRYSDWWSHFLWGITFVVNLFLESFEDVNFSKIWQNKNFPVYIFYLIIMQKS